MKSLSEAARNARVRRKQYVKYKEGAELYSMGVTQFMKMAHDCDSVIKIGRSAWVDLDEFDRYFKSFKL